MITDTKLTIRMNNATKKECEAILNSLGMNMTTGINIFAKAVVRHRGIPFELKQEEPDSGDNEEPKTDGSGHARLCNGSGINVSCPTNVDHYQQNSQFC